MLIDTHCHLADERLLIQIDDVLERARLAGVHMILSPAADLIETKKTIEIANRYDYVWALVGVHPENVSDDVRKNLELIISNSKKLVGIGEIGLDFHYDKEKLSKNKQIKMFTEQVELANKLSLPVMIHMRDAEEEMTEVLNGIAKLPRGQFHCWSGGEKFLEYVLKKGFYVSFCGNITYKSAGNLRELIKKVPLDRLLLETDSPYLAPEGKRGSLNEPSNVKIIAEYIANLLNLPVDTLINQTTKNTECLYFHG